MKFHCEFDIPALQSPIGHRSHTLMIGSCFTENMGEKLAKHLFHVLENPNGVLFNPVSVAEALTQYIDTPTFITKEIVNIEIVQQFFSGYEITVENAHLFLTKSDVDSNKSYVSIEHNINESCYSGTINCDQSDCSKGEYCVQTFNTTPCGTAFFCDCQPNCSVDGGPSEF